MQMRLGNKAKKNVLFCIIQSRDCEEHLINQPLYELQEALVSCGGVCRKAFVYGDGRICTRPFGSVGAEKICYADSMAKETDAAGLLIVADAMLREQMAREPDAEHILVVVSERERELERTAVNELLAFYGAEPPGYRILLVRKRGREKGTDRLEQFFAGCGGVSFSFDESAQAAAWLRGGVS